jgi:hypothetical protein
MSCPVCPQKMTPAVYHLFDKACGSCQRHIRQMMAGFHGVMVEHRKEKNTWDNSEAYEDWKSQLTANDTIHVNIHAKEENEAQQRCDIRDMKRVCGLPKLLPLEQQVFTAWMLEGAKDERMQEVLGLTYSQLFQVKKVVKIRLQKQMAYYHSVKRLEKENNDKNR